MLLMILLAAVGAILLLGGRQLARIAMGREHDSVAATRFLQILGAAILIGALFTRPYNPETRAVPPPPDAIQPAPR